MKTALTTPVVLRNPTAEEIAQAKLPARYEAAKAAIAACDQLDELKDLADKQAALAGYARQAQDNTLHIVSLRIQQRATRRYGQLLALIKPANGTRTDLELQDGAVQRLTREQAATDAGLSERQRKTGLRLANIPDAEFEAAIESATPPTVTELAIRGTAPRSTTSEPELPPAQEDVYDTQSGLQAFAEFCDSHEPASIAPAIAAADAAVLRGYVQKIDRWLDRFVSNLR